MNIDAPNTYIGRIRNPAKQIYARRYWDWLCDHRKDCPDSDSLSFMAKQAVRMDLHEIADRESLNYRKP